MTENCLYKELIIKLLPPNGCTKMELFELISKTVGIPLSFMAMDLKISLHCLVNENLLEVKDNNYYKTEFCQQLFRSNYSHSFVVKDIQNMYAEKRKHLSNSTTNLPSSKRMAIEEHETHSSAVMREGFLNLMSPDEIAGPAHMSYQHGRSHYEPPRKKLHLDETYLQQHAASFSQMPSSSNNCGSTANIQSPHAGSIYYPDTSSANSPSLGGSGDYYQQYYSDSDEESEPAPKRRVLEKPPYNN